MIGPNEREVLRGIERELQDSDPDLATGLRTLTPVRRRPGALWILAGVAVVAMLLGIAAAIQSQLTVSLLAMGLCTAATCAWLVVVVRRRLRRRTLLS